MELVDPDFGRLSKRHGLFASPEKVTNTKEQPAAARYFMNQFGPWTSKSTKPIWGKTHNAEASWARARVMDSLFGPFVVPSAVAGSVATGNPPASHPIVTVGIESTTLDAPIWASSTNGTVGMRQLGERHHLSSSVKHGDRLRPRWAPGRRPGCGISVATIQEDGSDP